MAGRGGIGEGDLPVRPGKAAALSDGEPAACEPEKDDRRDPGRTEARGGSIGVGCGVDGTDAVGVAGAIGLMELDKEGFICSVNSEAEVIADPASDTFDPRRARLGRLPDGKEGVRE